NKALKEQSAGELNFTELPKNLRFFKPQNSMNATCQKLLDAGKSLNLRKRNGMMHAILINEDGSPVMYSLNMLPGHKDEPEIPWLERYPQVEEALRKLNLPPKTILLGELCTAAEGRFEDEDGLAIDDYQYVSTIVKSHTEEALRKQKEGGFLGYCIWDVPFLGSDECRLQTMTAQERFDELSVMLSEYTVRGNIHPYITMPEIVSYAGGRGLYVTIAGRRIEYTIEEGPNQKVLMGFAKYKKWEGFVCIDPNCVYDDKAYNFHGKPERP